RRRARRRSRRSSRRPRSAPVASRAPAPRDRARPGAPRARQRSPATRRRDATAALRRGGRVLERRELEAGGRPAGGGRLAPPPEEAEVPLAERSQRRGPLCLTPHRAGDLAGGLVTPRDEVDRHGARERRELGPRRRVDADRKLECLERLVVAAAAPQR